MTNILISVAAKIAEYLVHPILHQFGYLRNFNKNVCNLTQETEKLKSLKLQVNQAAEQAKRKGEVVEPEVQRWVAGVDEILNEVDKIEEKSKVNKNCFGGWCPNCLYRYFASRKSTKKVVSISGLQGKGRFDRISHPPPLPVIESSSSKDFMIFESRISTMDQILNALGGDESSVVVLNGTRGIGKTALAKEVGKRVKEQKLFDEVVMAVVSKTPTYIRNIQYQLADMLGLKFEEESEMGRACRLCLRLKNERKILVILDDVWERPDLVATGIPLASDHKGCKILITTQNENIWRAIGEGTKKVELKGLLEEESWRLFRSVTSEIVDTRTFKHVSREIVGKCKGLPLLLVTIGKKLRHKRIEEWEYESREIGDLETNKKNLDDLLDDYA